ncbi:type I restriction-modification system subunit M N-terminal domain-containing protein [Polaromonas sp. P1-6]|nr:type I restriction-modification system subunit M N-terminal domain-containing protein [Polaromonas sp. P1-6]
MNSATIVQKLWNYCNVLRDDGMSYGDYVEQLTYLLFLRWPTSAVSRRGVSPAQLPRATTGPRCWRVTATSCLTTTVTRWKSWGLKRARLA